MRTSEVAAIDEATSARGSDLALMKLSDVVASTYFTTREHRSALGVARMIYDVRQETIYHYASPVAYAHHVLRLTPIDRAHQRVHAAALDIMPTPIERREGQDFFGNRITWIAFDQPHDTLTVRVAARIAVEQPVVIEPGATPPWEEVRDGRLRLRRSFAAGRRRIFCFRAARCRSIRRSATTCALSFPPGRPILAGATDLMNRIKAEFVYEVGATTASTTPPMSFALRRGVCQDFTHIMISGMRSLGLPVAYVSGYLRTVQSRRRKAARRRRRHARLGAGLVRRVRAGSASIRPTPSWPAPTTSCSRSAATTPTWRRSMASFSPPARSGWRRRRMRAGRLIVKRHTGLPQRRLHFLPRAPISARMEARNSGTPVSISRGRSRGPSASRGLMGSRLCSTRHLSSPERYPFRHRRDDRARSRHRRRDHHLDVALHRPRGAPLGVPRRLIARMLIMSRSTASSARCLPRRRLRRDVAGEPPQHRAAADHLDREARR